MQESESEGEEMKIKTPHWGSSIRSPLIFLALFAATTSAYGRDVTFEWDAYTDESAVGIDVFTQEFNFAKSACDDTTTAKVTNAPLPVTDTQVTLTFDDALSYCVWIRAVAADGTMSDYSNSALHFAPKDPFTGPSNVRVAP